MVTMATHPLLNIHPTLLNISSPSSSRRGFSSSSPKQKREHILLLPNAAKSRRSFLLGILMRHLGPLSPPPQVIGTGIDESSIDISRRTSLMLPFWALTSMVSSNEAFASEEESGLGTSFLRNLGIGDMDIYYPKIFEGTWACYSTLISVDTPQGEDRADKKSVDFAKKQLGYTVEYQARFIPYKTHVIADRLFTTASLVESTVGKNVIDHGIWFPDKPNRISLILRGGVKVENTVTKRSFSLSAPNQFDSSEFSQQVFDNPRVQSGPPTIKASRNQTRYKWEPSTNQVSTIEAFQRVAMFPIPMEDGLSGFDIFNMDKPVTIYKYLVRFERVPS